PVSVNRLYMFGIGLAAPADEEALGNRVRLVDHRLRDGRAARSASGLGDKGERHDGGTGEVVARGGVVDVEQLLETPLRGQARERRLDVDAWVARADQKRPRLRRRQARLQMTVDEEPPNLLERHDPDELLDVYAPVAERPAFLVRFGDLGRE